MEQRRQGAAERQRPEAEAGRSGEGVWAGSQETAKTGRWVWRRGQGVTGEGREKRGDKPKGKEKTDTGWAPQRRPRSPSRTQSGAVAPDTLLTPLGTAPLEATLPATGTPLSKSHPKARQLDLLSGKTFWKPETL